MDYIKKFEKELVKLTPTDDDFVFQINDLIESIPEKNHEELIPTIFHFFEKYPLDDWGIPGILVHLIEDYYPNYKQLLLDSLKRKPTYHTILMVNRILNSELTDEERYEYELILRKVKDDEKLSEELRNEAKQFIEYQSNTIKT